MLCEVKLLVSFIKFIQNTILEKINERAEWLYSSVNGVVTFSSGSRSHLSHSFNLLNTSIIMQVLGVIKAHTLKRP